MCPRPRALGLCAAAVTLVVMLAPAPVVAPAPPAARAGIIGTLAGGGCSVLGTFGEGWMGKLCNGAGKALGVVSTVASNPVVQRAASLAAIVAWVLGGAHWTISHVAAAISETSSPALSAGWFTSVYLRVEAIAWLLTLPLLVAACAQAVLRAEPGVLARVLGYLPLAAVLTGAAVPLTMLLLAVTDALSSAVAQAAGQDGTQFLTGASAWVVGGLSVADPFVAVAAGMVLVCCGLALWCELVVRELAVYVVVLMLPLVFCAIVWPARRIWALRTVEVLFALILAKFAIIVPLAVGTAALAHGGAGSGAGRLIAGLALVLIGCLAPWVLLRLIPLAELASAAVGQIRGQLHAHAQLPTPEAHVAGRVAGRLASRNGNPGRDADVHELLQGMIRRARQAEPADPPPDQADDPPLPAARASTRDQTNGSSANPDAPVAQQTAPGAGDLVTADRSTAAPPASSPPGSRAGERAPVGGGASGTEAETMVEQADGSWQPLRSSDPDAASPRAPSEHESSFEDEPPGPPPGVPAAPPSAEVQPERADGEPGNPGQGAP